MIDNRDLAIVLTQSQIEALCDRHRGIGADGLLAVEPAEQGADYKFRYYNADGGEAEMCGNGARCFAKFVATLENESVTSLSFETIAGVLSAEMIGDDVCVSMSDPFDLELNISCDALAGSASIHTINTGVPHAVSFVDNLQEFDVEANGHAIRYHSYFAPSGTNVNFASALTDSHIAIRTYERGVEGETLACGTGMCAAAIIHHLLTGDAAPIKVDVAGGETLLIGFDKTSENQFVNVTLSGPADLVYEGTINMSQLKR